MIEANPRAFLGHSITVVGNAENAHQGAIVTLSDSSEVYVLGLRRWEKALLGKRLEVTGLLRSRKLAPDPDVNEQGEVSHGMFGSSLILEDATWKELR